MATQRNHSEHTHGEDDGDDDDDVPITIQLDTLERSGRDDARSTWAVGEQGDLAKVVGWAQRADLLLDGGALLLLHDLGLALDDDVEDVARIALLDDRGALREGGGLERIGDRQALVGCNGRCAEWTNESKRR